jgi:UDP-GlcNAc:undecaprenyl-phosphate GlcNAc-1-phosphate transferase
MSLATFILFTAACAASCALTFVVRRVALKIGLVDRPDNFRKLHQRPIPLGGGIAVFVASAGVAILACAVPNPLQEEILADAADLWPLLFAGLAIVVVGVLDDKVSLRGRQKFLGQVLAASILVAGGFSMNRIVVLGFPIELGQFGFIFALFWLVGAINSVNLLDGMDGFATVLGIILSAATALIAAVSGHVGVAILATVFSGSLLGFLWWNLPPAKIFLGDAGSMLIGLTVGTLAIAGAVKGPGTVLLAAPLAVWTIPVLDSAAAILRRRLTGRSVYTTDRSHIHHRLLDRFGNSLKVLVAVTLLCLATAAGALASLFYRNDLVALITSGAVVSIVVATGWFGRAECSLLLHSIRNLGVSMVTPAPHKDRNGRQSVVRLQGSRRWEILWETLVESAEKLGLSEIRFDVNLPAMREGFHASWRCDAPPKTDDRLWSLGTPLERRGVVIGRLLMVGQSDAAPISNRLEQIGEMLDSVGTILDTMEDPPPAPSRPAPRRKLIAHGPHLRPRPSGPENQP